MEVCVHFFMVSAKVAEWEARYEVILAVAHALEYLHHGCVIPIMHGDVKAMNVLLGPNMEPHLADFGLARFVSGETDPLETSKQNQRPHLAGSYGYIAPEHASTQHITEKSDVYSFGGRHLRGADREAPITPNIARWCTFGSMGSQPLAADYA